MTNATTFETGATYYTRFACDADSILEVTIASRTAKTVTTTEGKRLRVALYEGVESIKPTGSYSMAPVIVASRRR